MDGISREAVEVRAAALRETLRQIDAGEVTATAAQRAYLSGALGALEELIEH